jgi:hypothetical protein
MKILKRLAVILAVIGAGGLLYGYATLKNVVEPFDFDGGTDE